MTTPDLSLARRAVACPGWRWVPGMRWHVLPTGAPDDGGDAGRCGESAWAPVGAIPVLDDPATLGCLLALVREARGDPAIHVRMSEDGTAGVYSGERYLCHQHGEAEALVAALEATPRRTT